MVMVIPVVMVRQRVVSMCVVGQRLVEIKFVTRIPLRPPQGDAGTGEEALIDHIAVRPVVLAGEAHQWKLIVFHILLSPLA